MEKESLFVNEQLISESNDKTITLTSHRIRYSSSSLGKAHVISIMLEKVSSIEVHYKSNWILLVISILLMGGGLLAGANNRNVAQAALPVMAIGIVLLLIYLFTRRHVVTIASDGGARIAFETKGMKREAVMNFIDKIEKAKSERN